MLPYISLLVSLTLSSFSSLHITTFSHLALVRYSANSIHTALLFCVDIIEPLFVQARITPLSIYRLIQATETRQTYIPGAVIPHYLTVTYFYRCLKHENRGTFAIFVEQLSTLFQEFAFHTGELQFKCYLPCYYLCGQT